MIAELDCVALTENLPEHGLAAGDLEAVVHIYKDGNQFVVEFTTFNGRTVAIATVSSAQITMNGSETPRSRTIRN